MPCNAAIKQLDAKLSDQLVFRHSRAGGYPLPPRAGEGRMGALDSRLRGSDDFFCINLLRDIDAFVRVKHHLDGFLALDMAAVFDRR